MMNSNHLLKNLKISFSNLNFISINLDLKKVLTIIAVFSGAYLLSSSSFGQSNLEEIEEIIGDDEIGFSPDKSDKSKIKKPSTQKTPSARPTWASIKMILDQIEYKIRSLHDMKSRPQAHYFLGLDAIGKLSIKTQIEELGEFVTAYEKINTILENKTSKRSPSTSVDQAISRIRKDLGDDTIKIIGQRIPALLILLGVNEIADAAEEILNFEREPESREITIEDASSSELSSQNQNETFRSRIKEELN